MSPIPSKFVCTSCHTEKLDTEFYSRKSRPKKPFGSCCKQCISDRAKTPSVRKLKAEIARKSNAKLKREVFMHYSDGLMKCACCGEGQLKFLTLDHIDGGGREHREKLGSPAMVYRDVRSRNYPLGFQVLCYNCNCGRSQNKGVCPHKEL